MTGLCHECAEVLTTIIWTNPDGKECCSIPCAEGREKPKPEPTDTARLDWLDSNQKQLIWSTDSKSWWIMGMGWDATWMTVRQAIDAAMEAQDESQV